MALRGLVSNVVAVALLLATANSALGHARFIRSEPEPDAVLVESPGSVTVWFGELLEVEGSRIQVFGPDGSQTDLGDSGLLANDHKALAVGLFPGLGPGTYVVVWENVSAEDGDSSRGEFTFTICEGCEE